MKKGRVTRWLKRLLLLVVVASGVAFAQWSWHENPASATPEFELVEVERGDLAQSITATGALTPVSQVQVGSQISGNIQELFADFNTPVKAGQVIAKLEPATYEASLLRAQGDLDNAKSDLELARINEKRALALRKDKLNAEAEYDVAQADLHKAEAAVKIAEGLLKKAQVDLARCTIYSPIDGLVVSRNVDVGQTVAASLSAPVLFVIVNDLTKMQIEANVVEADVGVVREGQTAEFRVDAYPNEKFKGKVAQVRNAPREEMNVVVYRTIIEVSNRDLKLKPGMTATVAIIVANRDGALKIPNAALRFKPPKGIVTMERDPGVAETVTNALPSSGGKSGIVSSKTAREKSKQKPKRKVYLLPTETPSTESGHASALREVEIQCGITDGRDTELLGGLREGDRVVTGVAKAREREKLAFNPFAFLSR